MPGGPFCLKSCSLDAIALGLVLLGVLAELDALLRAPRSIDEFKVSMRTEAIDNPLVLKGVSAFEDFGQPLDRSLDVLDDLEDELGRKDIPSTDSSMNSVAAPVTLISSGEHCETRFIPVAKPKSSKKGILKSRNAIDELFSGIG